MILLKGVCRPGGLLDLAVAEVMGYSQKEMAEIFNATPGAISKRITAQKPELFGELTEVILRESAKEVAKLIAKQAFERITENIETTAPPEDENE